MALTAAVKRTIVGESQIVSIASNGDDTYYEGALLVIDANGYLNVPAGAATDIPAGAYTGRQGQALAVASGSHDELEMERGLVWVPFSGAAQGDVGELFYPSDDSTMTQTAGSMKYAVMCVGFKTGYVLLDYRNILYV
ncbi:MAG TPA: hypothetical protein VM223_21055 [Planctomycetota bacterium]|nr:hypothetical protein [Planctomycetota bacterium]